MSATTPWRIWIDSGGTFTDGIGVAPDRTLQRIKVLSSGALRGTVARRVAPRRLRIEQSWGATGDLLRGMRFHLLGVKHATCRVAGFDPSRGLLELDRAPPSRVPDGAAFELRSGEVASLLVARLLTHTSRDHPFPPLQLRLAGTLGTNALLERRGAPVALFLTRGFADLLLIGTQQRPDLFRLEVIRPRPLYERVVEVTERLDAEGRVLRPLALRGIEAKAREMVARGIRSAAVALLHAFRNPAHEIELQRRLREWGFTHVSRSSELAPRIKLLVRAETAVVDAYLGPVIHGYLESVRAATRQLLVMTSAGGMLAPRAFHAKDSLLSGPAAGVVGADGAARGAGFRQSISFDMGGTSTDVARIAGDYEYLYEHRVGDAHLAAPAVAIESVAAGGGSVCWLDGERLRVGPRSAGARPGPACYGAGGPLTLTDVNLLAGRLEASRFGIPIRIEPARQRFDELRRELERRTGERPTEEALLEGLQAIANETMADAIRTISVRRGYDASAHALVTFGGAGGQHACGVAARLGMRSIVVPVDGALLSALGLGQARVERFVERQVLSPLGAVERALPRLYGRLAEEAARAVVEAGVAKTRVRIRRRLAQLRLVGQDSSIEVDWSPSGSLGRRFRRRYEELYGHRPERREIELESIRVVASSSRSRISAASLERPSRGPRSKTSARAVFGGRWRRVRTYDRHELPAGSRIAGPALIWEPHSATVVEPGWSCEVDPRGALILRLRRPPRGARTTAQPEAVRLELFTRRFTGLVEEMGQRLERTAVSTNVKERLDFSCALLDRWGVLVANAPHIPVHLGALGLAVRSVAAKLALSPGDTVVTNHPLYGGSHLPDVTVITPVFSSDPSPALLGYVASRAHHAEIGGARPGSMPPAARHLAEEGVVLPPRYLIRAGRPRFDEIRRLLLDAPYPTRNVEDNLADLRAAAAANHAGAERLRALVRRHGRNVVARYMERLEGFAEHRMHEALRKIPDGSYAARETLDDGTPLEARIELAGERARIDFSGSAPEHPGNLNAPPAIVHSVVIYLLRLLLSDPLPLNEGLMRAVDIDLPRGLLNPAFSGDPQEAPAVVGGNVETSQRLVDTLLKALRLVACSQGTMNNVIFGNPRYGYYETLGGGCGAGEGFHGASGVHSHMTNTRITDVEVLEHRYPVRVERFGLRRGSGGRGRFRGGDGLVREIRFLEPASLSILSQHRRSRPYGLSGGHPGKAGRQRVLRRGGAVTLLGAIDGCEVAAGDRLVVETPGGGGYGKPR